MRDTQILGLIMIVVAIILIYYNYNGARHD